MVVFGAANLAILLVVWAVKQYAVHLAMVCVRGDRESDHRRLFLEKQRGSAVRLRAVFVRGGFRLQSLVA